MRVSLVSLLAWPAFTYAAHKNLFVSRDTPDGSFNVSEAIEQVKAESNTQANFRLNSAFSILGVDAPAELLELPIGTCNAGTPCPNGACCSSISGLCGYSPAECGVGNCTSNCGAKAECGKYGAPGKQTCPLGVCCSNFGFCGSTDDFCDADKGCQKAFGGCGPAKRPSCSKDGTSINKRSIGYYETWANTRKCDKVAPEDINLQGLTHINFSFMFFEPDTFDLTPMDKNAGSLISRFTNLKTRKPGLETWVSVGGWSFNDPGKYQQAFSTMSSTAANRKKFIGNLIRFMESYGFDGMDMDWEYPTADDRGGKLEDKANFVLLSKDISEAFSKKGYGYSLTLPASYWYLQHFDLAKLQPYVNWFNLMSYDLHGTWDEASKFVGPYVATHTNLTEIELGLDLLWRAGVKAENVVLGQGLYGRSFTLKDPKCNKPNGICQFSGGAKPGRCSNASGILNLQEILDIIEDKKLKPTHDKKSGTKWIHWDNDQWVSYDDDETLMQKREFAASRCLGGMMVWAIDQIDQADTMGGSMTPEELEEAETIYQDEAAKGVCYTTMCGDKCRTGDHEASQMTGQPGLLSTMARCPKDQVRRLCCSKGTTMGTCQWRGFRGLGMSCTGGCRVGETEVTINTNHRTKDEDQSCTGGTQSYCCSGFKPPISKEQIAEKFKDEAADLALEAGSALALEMAAKAFCRTAIMAATLPLRLIPFVGWIISIALQVAMPALTQVCAKGVAKAGKSIFKFKGKDYEVQPDKPLTSKVDRPASKSPTKASNKPSACKAPNKLAGRAVRDLKPIYDNPTWVSSTGTRITTRFCDGNRAEQACYNYQSIIARRPDLQRLICPSAKGLSAARDLVTEYNKQHNTLWSSGWLREANLQCERDEYPGANIWQGRTNDVWIRLIPKHDNRAAGHLFVGCPDRQLEVEVDDKFVSNSVDERCRTTEVRRKTLQLMKTVIVIDFKNMGNAAGFGIRENPCWPSTLVNDPGFALLTNDPWYKANDNQYINLYKNPPTDKYTRGKVNQYSWGFTKGSTGQSNPNQGSGGDVDMDDAPDDDSDTSVPDNDSDYEDRRRRALHELHNNNRSPTELIIDEGNSTRWPTKEELFDDLGLLKCEGKHCEREMEGLGFASLPVIQELATSPATAEAAATASVTGSSPDASGVSASLSYALEVPAQVSEVAESIITPAPRHRHHRRHGHGYGHH